MVKEAAGGPAKGREATCTQCDSQGAWVPPGCRPCPQVTALSLTLWKKGWRSSPREQRALQMPGSLFLSQGHPQRAVPLLPTQTPCSLLMASWQGHRRHYGPLCPGWGWLMAKLGPS